MPLAAALNAPPLHGFSPVRPWQAGLPLAPLALQPAQGLAALPLARHGQSTGPSVSGLTFSPPHKSRTPGTAHRAETLVVCVDERLDASGKAVVGCASAATLCGA